MTQWPNALAVAELDTFPTSVAAHRNMSTFVSPAQSISNQSRLLHASSAGQHKQFQCGSCSLPSQKPYRRSCRPSRPQAVQQDFSGAMQAWKSSLARPPCVVLAETGFDSAPSAGSPQQSKPVYKGIYSDWTVEEEDVREVVAYRAGLNIAAAGELS